jgi:hypothetical protein
MKRNAIIWTLMVGWMPGLAALAGEASSGASASSNRWGPGTAAATAGYQGNGIGFARTNTRSGNTNFAQGLSVGFDEEGLSLSTSYAVAPRFGTAAAGTMNVAIGLDGSVATSAGRTVADGDPDRRVDASGSARPGSYGRSPAAVATTGGATGPRGTVVSRTHSDSRPGGFGAARTVNAAPRARSPRAATRRSPQPVVRGVVRHGIRRAIRVR